MNKALAMSGVASRRKAAELVAAGRVRVNGSPVLEPGTRVDPERDILQFDGTTLRVRRHFRYVLLNKPAGVITTASDERGRRCVLDLIPESRGLNPVGRLDKDTEGVLLLTDDGNLAFRLTHPRFGVEKLYEAEVEGAMGDGAARRLEKGIRMEDGALMHGRVEIVKRNPTRSQIRVEIHEGRKRQVRNMLESVGHPVIRLDRIRFAGLTAHGLKRGDWRVLKSGEVRRLYEVAGLRAENPSDRKRSRNRNGVVQENRLRKSGL